MIVVFFFFNVLYACVQFRYRRYTPATAHAALNAKWNDLLLALFCDINFIAAVRSPVVGCFGVLAFLIVVLLLVLVVASGCRGYVFDGGLSSS